MDPVSSAGMNRVSVSAGQKERTRVPQPFAPPSRTIGAKFSRASSASVSISDDPTKSKADLSFIFDKKSPSMGSAAAAATPVPVGPSVERRSGRDTGPMKTAAVSGTGYAPAEMVSLRSAMAASDSSKTVFEHMSFEDALLYLKAREGAVDYVHCVARHHVDHKARTNTYDLVMLEKPGHPETDQVFSRDNRSDRRKQGRFPGRLMQLSLQGLIMDAQDLPAAGDKPVSVDGGSGVFVPLNVFQHERDLCFRLLDMSFFRCFKQYKAFRAWRQHSRQRVFRRRARHVESNSLFADLPLISLMFEIHRRVYELGQSIDLFEYLGSGLLNIRSYLRAQENKLYQEFAKIKASILEIGELIEARYMHVVSTAYLGEKIDAIIVHHPYSMSKTSGAGLMLNTAAPEDVNWENVRSVQRLKAEYKGKIEQVFRSAEMMIETMLGSVLLRFWSRLTRSVAGVTIVNRDAARAAIGYWAQSEEINYEKQAAIAKATSDLEGVGMDPSSPGARRKEVDDSITRKGRHLNINSAFFLDNRPFDPDSQQSTKDIAKLKISIDPSSSQVMHYLHELYGVLGVLLNNLPKLKFHPVIYKEDQTVDLFQDHESAPAAGASRAPTPAGALKKRSHWRRGESMPTPTPESEASLVTRARNETKSAASSSLLFVYIQNCTILVQMGAQQISVRALHQFRIAVSEASMVEDVTSQLHDIFNHIWALNPTGVLKQLERSSLLPMLKDGINGTQNFSAEDLDRSLARERTRLNTLLGSISYLEAVETMLQSFPDLKHSQGVVCTFKIAIQQLSRIREKQLFKLTSALPFTFISRCRLFTDFLFVLQKRLDPSLLGGFDKEIKMLKAVEHFDSTKALFDEECEICEQLYRTMWSQQQREDGDAPTATSIKKLAPQSSSTMDALLPQTRIKNASSNPHSLFSLYNEAKHACNDSIVGCRLELGRVLSHIKKEVLQRIHDMHVVIEKYKKELDDVVEIAGSRRKLRTEDFLGGDSGASGRRDALDSEAVQGICDLLEDIQRDVGDLRKDVKEAVSIQQLLLQSHAIVGSALPILSVDEVEYFKDMEILEAQLQIKSKSWLSVGEALSIHAGINATRLNQSNVSAIYLRVKFFSEIIDFLKQQVDNNNPALLRLRKIVNEIRPQLEILAYLTCNALRRSHWEILADSTFSPLNYSLFVAGHGLHSVTVSELVPGHNGGSDLRNLGGLRTLPLSDLMDRGMFHQLHKLKDITATAMMQSMIEKTLTAASNCMSSAAVVFSNAWLQDQRLRDKIPFELQRVANCDELSVLFQYCFKAVLVAEHTAVDMNIGLFDSRIGETKLMLGNIIDFVKDLDAIQQRWFGLFKFMKFSAQGDVDRDTLRLYQLCTEEMKKVEILLNEGYGHGSFLDSFIRLTESEINPKMILTNLNIVLEDMHTNVQSILDACPRLAVLPYHRLRELIKLWICNPLGHMDFVSECFHEMFEGVRTLRLEELKVQRSHVCKGFLSCDKSETILFDAHIPLSMPIDDFINLFENKIREAITKGCDAMNSHRIDMTRMLLNDVLPERVVLVTKEIFSTRISMIRPQESVGSIVNSNQSTVLMNLTVYAEDVWLCLGFAVGSVLLAKPELEAHLEKTFVPTWRTSLRVLFDMCTEMIEYCRTELADINTSQQRRALLGSLLQLEVGHLQTVKDLMQCNCRDSALEMWSGRYQLRYLYDEKERVRQCPFEVTIGCVSLPYGMEYFGGLFPLHLGPSIEYAVSKAIGSAFSYKGTIFLSYETDESPLEVKGEYSVSCKDVSIALGRMYSVLASVHNPNSVKLFLARLIYLDAVGCVDFTTMGEPGIQMLVDALAQMWTAIERKDDFFMVGSLKYPLKTNAVRAASNATHKRKAATSSFMHSMNTKGGVYSGIYLIGMASETLYAEASVFNQFSNSVFNTVAVDHSRPTEDLGVMLSIAGFSCGVLLQELFEHVVIHIRHAYSRPFPELKMLTSTAYIRRILRRASEFYAADKFFHISANKGNALSGFQLLRFEVQIFVNALWDVILTCIGGSVLGDAVTGLRQSVVSVLQMQLNAVLNDAERFVLNNVIPTAKKTISDIAEQEIQRACRTLKYVSDPLFLACCYATWQQLCSKSSCLGILHGSCASGKTAVRKTVLTAMRAYKGLEFIVPSVVSSSSTALAGWKAAMMLTRVIKRWKQRKQMFIGDGENCDPVNMPFAEVNLPFQPGQRFNRKTEELDGQDMHSIKSIIIHHNSLSCEHLVGTFDGMGRWSDGLLLRAIRNYDVAALQKKSMSAYSQFCVIILDGPMGSQIEQLFSGSRYNTGRGMPANHEIYNNLMVFPSGESCKLSADMSILIETSDLSQASPSMLLYTAKVDVTACSTYCSKRLVKAWSHQFIPELLRYGPWEEAAKEIEQLMQSFTLISDLLYFDSSDKNTSNCAAVSKTSGFLRYLEELLLQCHELFLAECIILHPEDKSKPSQAAPRQGSMKPIRQSSLSFMIEEDEPLEPQIETIPNRNGIVYMLDPSGQEMMMQRVRCSFMFAAIWAFGGSENGSERRKFFETVAKMSFTVAFGPYAQFPSTCSLFDTVLDLKEGIFAEALDHRRLSKRVHRSLEQFVVYNASALDDAKYKPRPRRGSHVVQPSDQLHALAAVDVEEVVVQNGIDISVGDAEVSQDPTEENLSADPTNLRFFTAGTWALSTSMDTLFRSGARLMLSGMACSGKTALVKSMLQKYGTRCPHPRNMKRDMLNCLLDIIAGDKMPEGTPAVMDILTSFLNKIGSNASGLGNLSTACEQETSDAAAVWYAIRTILQENDSYKASTREHCATQTVFSSSVSLRVVPTAGALRDWLVRELGTENKNVLEAPRFTRAVVFIDDLHMAENHADGRDKNNYDRIIENRLEGVLRGILQSDGSFIIPAAFHKTNKGESKGEQKSLKKKILELLREPNNENRLPVLHRALLSDPREDSLEAANYFMDDVGVLAAGTGDFRGMERSPELKQLLQHFCVVSTPMTTINEIHSALVQGSTRVLSGCPLELQPGGVQVLSLCLRDLSTASVVIMRMLTNSFKTQEAGLSVLEGSQRKLLFLSMPVIRRLCATLSIARQLITSQISLLQLWVHEWKRNYLDVFPHGVQRSRVVEIIQEQLDKIDFKKWHISPTAYQAVVSDVEVATGSVWVDVDRLLRRAPSIHNIGVSDAPSASETLGIIEEDSDEDSAASEAGPDYFLRYTPVAMFTLEDGAGREAAVPFTPEVVASEQPTVHSIPLRMKLPSSLSLLSVLYPAAIAMMLRIVRVLTSISTHVVISGFVGSSRLPVIHLSGSIINHGVEIFEVPRCQKATEFNPYTEYSSVSLDLKSFLKRCVMRVCGVRIQENVGSVYGPAVFAAFTPEPVLMALSSAQLLNPAERRTLLNVIDGDYAALFENREIEGLALIFHEQFLSFNGVVKESTLSSESMDAGEDPSDLDPTIDSDTTSEGLAAADRKVSASSNRSRKSTGGIRRQSAAVLMESLVLEMKEQSSVTKKSSWGRSAASSRILLGYTYNWVKSVLREKVFGKLKIILSLDFPRVAPISTSYTSTESVEVEESNAGSFVENVSPTLHTAAKRFSLMTGKSRVTRIPVAQAPEQARPTSRVRSVRTKGGKRSSATSVDEGIPVATEQTFLLSSNTEKNLSSSSVELLFYDCPVLGGVLTHKFCHLWWDISSFQSIQGVCYNLLRNSKSPHFKTPHLLTVASRNIIMVESSQKSELPIEVPSVGITKWNLRLYHGGNNNTSTVYRKFSNIQYLGVFLTFAKKDGLYMTKPAMYLPDKHTIDDTVTAQGVDWNSASRRQRSSMHTIQSDVISNSLLEETQLESSTYQLLEAMVDEARHMLPHLLSLECPADSVILSQPVITMEPDRCAEVACRLVVQMIEDGGRMLLKRRDDCIAVDAMHKHTLFVLASADPIMNELKDSVEEMHNAMRSLSSSLIKIGNEIDSCRVDYTRSLHYELYLHSIEDVVSTDDNIKYLTQKVDSTTAASRANMLSINIKDWNLFGKLVEDPKLFVAYGITPVIIHMLRGVVLLADPHIRSKSNSEISELAHAANSAIGDGQNMQTSKSKLNEMRQSVLLKSADNRSPTRFTPHVKQQQQAAAQRQPVVLHMPDEEVYTIASDLLSSPDILSRLLARNSTNIAPSHMLELKAINQAISQADNDDADNDTDTLATVTTHSDSDLAGHLIAKLRELLHVQETVFDYTAHITALKHQAPGKKQVCFDLHAEVEREVADRLRALEVQRTHLEHSLQLLDAEISLSRIKIARLTNLKSCHERIIKAVEDHRVYVLDERKQLDSILKNLVSDSCIAVTCLARVGWLPEQTRQECLERFRNDLIAHKSDMHLTESPFLLGCMLDRLQIKRWTLTQQSTDTLPRDPGSINSMSLVMMNPAFTFVVDPEGAAAGPIRTAYRENYTIFEATGATFSLVKLERALMDTKVRSVACLITECQAGVSQDLISFLSADFELFEQENGYLSKKNGFEQSQATTTSSAKFERVNDVDRVVHSGIEVVFNGDHSDDKLHKRILNIFSFFGNLRVVLVSALGPIIDAAGCCTPLPPCCFKNMITVHWTSCHHASYYMDPKPFHSALGKSFAADYLLENCMVESICREIAPTHSIQMRLLSERVIEWSMRITNQEGDITTSLVKWLAGHPLDAMIPLIYTGDTVKLKHSYMTIGYLINEQCCNALLVAESKRNYLEKGVQSAKRLERDMICYQNAVGEACAMAADFLRVTSVILPVNLLPPYALTAKAIATKCVTGMITQNVGMLAMIPSALKDVHRILKGIQTVQKQFLKNRGKQKMKLPPSVKSRIAPGLVRGNGAMRSSFLGQRGSTLAAVIATPDDEIDNAVIAAQNMQFTLNRNGQPQVVNQNALNEKADANSPPDSAKDGPMYLDNMMGMKRKDRLNAVSAMHYFLQPVRGVLLKAAVAYVYNEVKPGFEWMVKFSILLTTWAQSSTPLPTDELRALFHFYSRIFSGDAQRVRYAFISATAAVPQEVEDTVEVGLPASTVLFKYENDCEDGSHSRPNSAGRVAPKRANNRISMIELLVGPESEEAGDIADNNGGAVAAVMPLPNVLTLNDRKTGFFSNESKPLSNGIKLLQNNLASFAVGKLYLNQLTDGTIAVSDYPVARTLANKVEDKVLRGPGGIDGLNIHRRSNRWRIKSAEFSAAMEVARDGLDCGQPIIRWDPVLCDVPGSEVTVKNEIFRAKIVVGNMFELDWLHASRGRLASISIPGVDVRSNVLHGTMGSSALTMGAIEAQASAMERSQDRRRSTAMRMTRITSHTRKTSRSAHYGGSNGAAPRRNSSRARKSRASRQVGDSRARDLSQAPVARSSNLRISLARRSVRKQSVSYIDSPVIKQTKRISKANSIRKSGLVSRLRIASKSVNESVDTNVINQSDQQTVGTEWEDIADGDEEYIPPLMSTPSSATMSPAVQAALAAAQKYKLMQEEMKSSSSRGAFSPSRSDLSKGILSLFESVDNYQEFKILERHPSLAPIFRGMSEGIGMYPEQFLEWKKFVQSLSKINFATISRPDLVHLAARIIPPQLEMEASDFSRGATNLGLWAMGKELTIIQTLLLTTVVSPASCRAVAELMFSLTDQYLQRGGIVIRHQDELSSDEESDSEKESSEDDSEDDFFGTIKEGDEEDEEIDETDNKLTLPTGGLSDKFDDVIRPSAACMNADDDDDDDDDDDSHSMTSRSSRNSERFRRGSRLQLGVSALNCWTHLKHASAGVIRPPGLRYAKKHSQYRYTCRSFEDWEGVLKDILSSSLMTSEFKLMVKSADSVITYGGQMENDELEDADEELEKVGAVMTHLKPFSALIKRSKYRILADLRSSTQTYRPFMPIFLGSHSALNYMSYLSLICRELGTYKGFHFSSSPRTAVINGSLLENRFSRFYQIGSSASATAKVTSASKNVADRKGRATNILSSNPITYEISNADRLRDFIKVVERGITSTAYLKIPSAKPNGGMINILEMLDMHSPVCSSIVWAAAVHHRSARARPEDDPLSDVSSFLNMSISLATAASVGNSSIDAVKSLTLEGLLGKTQNKAPLSSSRKNEVISVGKLAPVPMTAFWETNHSGFGPLMSLSEFQFHWLPSVSVPDLLSAGTFTEDALFLETPTPAVEGLVWEQLHASYLYTNNTIRRLAKITKDLKMKERIKHLSDEEIRVASGVLTFWRFILFLRSKNLEAEGRPGAWSQCLVPLSMWQVARIIFKVSDILKENWMHHIVSATAKAPRTNGILHHIEITVPGLLECTPFRRLVSLCAESLCYISYEDVSIPLPQRLDLIEIPKYQTSDADTVGLRRSTNVRSSIINVATSKANAIDKPKAIGMARTNRGTFRKTVVRTQSILDNALLAPTPPATVRPSNSLQFCVTSGSISLNRLDSGTKDLTDENAAPAPVAEVRYPTFKEIMDPSLFLKYKYKSSFGGYQLRDRLLSTLGRYFAEVITMRASVCSSAASEKIAKNAKNQSNTKATSVSVPVGISLYTTPESSHNRNKEQPKSEWPTLNSAGYDMNMGNVDADRLVAYISKWSLSEE